MQEYIDDNLPKICSNISVADMTINILPPKWSGASKSTEVVGSYAAVLKGMVRPLATGTETRYDSTSLRPRKRPTVAVANTNDTPTQQKDKWHTHTLKEPSVSTAQAVREVEQQINLKYTRELESLKSQVSKNTSKPTTLENHNQINLEEKIVCLQEDLESKLDEKLKMQQQRITEIINLSVSSQKEVKESCQKGILSA